MKPLKLTMQAFGPYPGREEIDFDSLSQAGIFLIKGPTGSGKTTIFDAISMALYGKSTVEEDKIKGGRNSLEVWRCNQADWETETKVEFTFLAGENTYQFIRRLIPKKKNLDTVYAVNILDENGDFQAVDGCTKEAELGAKAEEIIGLNSSQFRQVVLLPQGKFERFLTADSNTKEDILCRLFDAGQWDKYAKSMHDRVDALKKALDLEKREVDNRLKDEEGTFDSIDSLNEYVDKLRKNLDELELAHKEYDAEGKAKVLDEERKLYDKFKRLHDLEGMRDTLIAQASGIEDSKNTLADAERAEKFREPIKAIEKLEKEIADRKRDLATIEELIPQLKEKESESKRILEEHVSGSPVDDYNTQIGVLNSKKSVYENIDNLSVAAATAEKEYKTAEKIYSQKNSEAGRLQENAVKCKASYDSLDENARILRNKYYANIYGDIAKTLTEGEPCPVCGSTAHPNPALQNEDAVTKEALEEAEAKSENARSTWDEAEKQRSSAEAELQKLKEAMDAALNIKKEADTRYEEATKNLIEGINSSKELFSQIEKMQTAITDYNKQSEILKQTYQEHHDSLQNQKLRMEVLSGELSKCEDRQKAQTESLVKLLHENEYANIEEPRGQLLSEEEKKSIISNISSYDTKVKSNKEDLKAQEELVKDKAEPDSESFSSRQVEIEKETRDYHENKVLITNRITRLTKKSGELSKLIKHYEENIHTVESDLAFAKKLRGDTGIGLQRYVLGIMFNQIITEANRMLIMVHGGRYQLYRTDERGSTNKRGLELLIHDNRRAEEKGRPVSSLSGGEKFLVSLSLSIGMSAVAQKSGLQIEALFIDEGFGTLDENSISDAMDILECVQKSNGMIGIISHVAILESNIQKHVEVIKTEKGSSVKVC